MTEQNHAAHASILIVRCSPGRECNGDVRHLDPETVQHVVEDRFVHLCVCEPQKIVQPIKRSSWT